MDATRRQALFSRAIHSRVCHNCDELREDKVCGLAGGTCPIETNIRDILQIAGYVQGDRGQAYMRELRSTACAACERWADPSRCPADAAARCAVNRYLELVFDAIDDVAEKAEAGAVVGAGLH
jgi:hypothetical protein